MATPVFKPEFTHGTAQSPSGDAGDTDACFVDSFKRLHAVFKLSGGPENDLLTASEMLLRYVAGVLRDEMPSAPDATTAEWLRLMELLRSHWIQPLLYWKVGHLPPSTHPPEEVYHLLRNAFMTSRVTSLKAGCMLNDILHAFAAENIPVIVLKGPALAFSIYPDPAIRSFSDLDLLVTPEHFVAARGALIRKGFKPVFHRFELFTDLQYEEHFSPHPGSLHALTVELHWNPLRSYGIKRTDTLQGLFDRALRIDTPAVSFNTLSHVDALILYSQHMILHHTQDIRLSWLYDISLLAGCISADEAWEELKQRCCELRGVVAVEYSLRLARCWTGLQLPDSVDNFSSWPKPCHEESTVITQVFAYNKTVRNMSLFNLSFYGLLLGQYLSREASLSGKIRLLYRLIFPGTEYLKQTHPFSSRWMIPVSYISYWTSWCRKIFGTR